MDVFASKLGFEASNSSLNFVEDVPLLELELVGDTCVVFFLEFFQEVLHV